MIKKQETNNMYRNGVALPSYTTEKRHIALPTYTTGKSKMSKKISKTTLWE